MITHHTRRTRTDRAEEDLGEQRWNRDAESGADLDYLPLALPADAIDELLYDLGWTKIEQDSQHMAWRSPSGTRYPMRGEALRIALLGKAAHIRDTRPGGHR
jgi:hypothetical protein